MSDIAHNICGDMNTQLDALTSNIVTENVCSKNIDDSEKVKKIDQENIGASASPNKLNEIHKKLSNNKNTSTVPDTIETPLILDPNKKYIQFSNQYICKNCVDGYDKICKYHTCMSCLQQADGYNSMLCQNCFKSNHISCMRLPIQDLFYKKWFCEICLTKIIKIPSGKIKGYITGKIDGIKVGSSWRIRLQMNENDMHRPGMAGIHGSGESPAYSIVLQGGYEKDYDLGDEFYYTGSGGRDENKNHIEDQTLTRSNLSLALSCDKKFTNSDSEALDWKKSSPVRVIRGFKLKKDFPKYAPDSGFRYDGIYKVVKYWKEKVPSGFYVWRYHFRRDDSEPTPWTNDGKKYIKEHDIKQINILSYDKQTMINVEQRNKKENKPIISKRKALNQSCKKNITNFNLEFTEPDEPKRNKKKHKKTFETFHILNDLIKKDSLNSNKWNELSNKQFDNTKEFIKNLKEMFTCLICKEFIEIAAPFTTNCGHNFCRPCHKIATSKNKAHCTYCASVEEITEEPKDVQDYEKVKNLNLNLNLSNHKKINFQLASILISFKSIL